MKSLESKDKTHGTAAGLETKAQVQDMGLAKLEDPGVKVAQADDRV